METLAREDRIGDGYGDCQCSARRRRRGLHGVGEPLPEYRPRARLSPSGTLRGRPRRRARGIYPGLPAPGPTPGAGAVRRMAPTIDGERMSDVAATPAIDTVAGSHRAGGCRRS